MVRGKRAIEAIDINKLYWYIADKQEELIEQAIADVVTPFVVNQPTIDPELKNQEIYITSAPHCGAKMIGGHGESSSE